MKRIHSYLTAIQIKQQNVLDNPAHNSAQKVSPAKTQGEMMGRRYVREWNPATGKTRGWNETLDHSGIIRQVIPDVNATGGSKAHYRFDISGKYTGKW